jgi:hypothetical protein
MKASCRLAENDIITRGVTVKIQQVAVRGNYENPTNDAKGEDETRDYNRQCLLVQTFCTNSVAANRTNFFILSKSWRTDDISHFYFVDIFPTEHVHFVKMVCSRITKYFQSHILQIK